ncbi:hypothetical protein GJ496_005833 [Pomphorhynchus laevis]|nr:hypothetical protein GJ496_005833 [Pomphorhynchus laevis]
MNPDGFREPDEEEVELAQMQFEDEMLRELVETENQMDECQMYMLYEQARANGLVEAEDAFWSLWIPGSGLVDEHTGKVISNGEYSQNNQLENTQIEVNTLVEQCSAETPLVMGTMQMIPNDDNDDAQSTEYKSSKLWKEQS